MATRQGAPSPEGFYSLEEAAAITGLHPGRLLRGVRQGRYALTPHHKPVWRARRKFLFPSAPVEAVDPSLTTLRA